MKRVLGARIVSWGLIAALAMIWAVAPLPARGADGDSSTTAKAAKKGKATTNRLPRYYSKIVDKQQREKIYAIQNEYQPKIAEARKALDAIVKDQNEKILAVLRPEQQKQVQEAEANAKKKATSAPADTAASPPAAAKPPATASAK